MASLTALSLTRNKKTYLPVSGIIAVAVGRKPLIMDGLLSGGKTVQLHEYSKDLLPFTCGVGPASRMTCFLFAYMDGGTEAEIFISDGGPETGWIIYSFFLQAIDNTVSPAISSI